MVNSFLYKSIEQLFPDHGKICIVTNCFPPYPKKANEIATGGISKKYERFVNELEKLGEPYNIISLYYQKKSYKQKGKRISRIGIYQPYYLSKSNFMFPFFEFFNIILFFKIIEILVKEKPGLVLIGSTFQLSIAPILAAKILGIEVIIEHDWLCPLYPLNSECNFNNRLNYCGSCLEYYLGFEQKKIIKKIFGFFSAFMLLIKRNIWNTCTIFVESDFFRLFYLNNGINPDKMYLVPPLSTIDDTIIHDINFLNNLKKNIGNKFILSYIGRLSKEKGIELLLDSVNKLNSDIKENYILLIAGDGPLREKVVKKANENNIVYLGYLEKEKLKSLYMLTDAVIIPTIVPENYPHVAIEAMQFNKILIGPETGGLKEILTAYNKGFIIDRITPDKLSNILNTIIKTY